jgi:hypothetical protein
LDDAGLFQERTMAKIANSWTIGLVTAGSVVAGLAMTSPSHAQTKYVVTKGLEYLAPYAERYLPSAVVGVAIGHGMAGSAQAQTPSPNLAGQNGLGQFNQPYQWNPNLLIDNASRAGSKDSSDDR